MLKPVFIKYVPVYSVLCYSFLFQDFRFEDRNWNQNSNCSEACSDTDSFVPQVKLCWVFQRPWDKDIRFLVVSSVLKSPQQFADTLDHSPGFETQGT